jgi:hypothetical protein
MILFITSIYYQLNLSYINCIKLKIKPTTIIYKFLKIIAQILNGLIITLLL